MTGEKIDVLLLGPKKATIFDQLKDVFNLHCMVDAASPDALLASAGSRIRGIAISATTAKADADLLAKLPRLEVVSTFGVGYDHVAYKWAAEHRIVVTNTPEVLNEEVADTALGLLLCTVRELAAADRLVRSGKWPERYYRLTPGTLRNATVGLIGMGRIGQAIARRLDAFLVKVVYHSRNPQPGVPYQHYPDLIAMARDVDVLLAIVPGGPSTKNLINRAVLDALGPEGFVINMARGTVVDEPELVKALQEKRIMGAGLDVYWDEPNAPKELFGLDNVVLLPHVGSASVATRRAMEQLVVDNILAWAGGKPLLTPVPETPWPPQKRT